MRFISFYGYTVPNHDKRHSFVSEDSYTLFYDRETQGVFKAHPKNITTSQFLFLFLILYPMMNFFPNDIMPYDNTLALFSIGAAAIIVSIIVGNSSVVKMNSDIKRMTLSKAEWEYYLRKGNRFYFRQIILMTVLLLFAISCIIFLYIFQSKWWLFGGIGTSLVVGMSITVFTKTRYLLYKNKLDVKLDSTFHTFT